MKKSNFFKNIKGKVFKKWLQHLLLFISHPFRKFFIFFSVLLLACIFIIGIPLIHGASLKQIPSWYQQLFSSDIPTHIRSFMGTPKQTKPKKFKKDIKLHHADVDLKPLQPELMDIEVVEEVEELEPTEPTKYTSWNIKKEISDKRTNTDSVSKNSVTEPQKIVSEPQKKMSEPQKAAKSQPSLKYQKLPDLPLTYFDVPKHISGETIIYGVNELSVNDVYLYLYGISTKPDVHDISKARAYLRDLISNANVECFIIAQTTDGLVSGICFADGQNINQSMVDAGFAENIAL